MTSEQYKVEPRLDIEDLIVNVDSIFNQDEDVPYSQTLKKELLVQGYSTPVFDSLEYDQAWISKNSQTSQILLNDLKDIESRFDGVPIDKVDILGNFFINKDDIDYQMSDIDNSYRLKGTDRNKCLALASVIQERSWDWSKPLPIIYLVKPKTNTEKYIEYAKKCLLENTMPENDGTGLVTGAHRDVSTPADIRFPATILLLSGDDEENKIILNHLGGITNSLSEVSGGIHNTLSHDDVLNSSIAALKPKLMRIGDYTTEYVPEHIDLITEYIKKHYYSDIPVNRRKVIEKFLQRNHASPRFHSWTVTQLSTHLNQWAAKNGPSINISDYVQINLSNMGDDGRAILSIFNYYETYEKAPIVIVGVGEWSEKLGSEAAFYERCVEIQKKWERCFFMSDASHEEFYERVSLKKQKLAWGLKFVRPPVFKSYGEKREDIKMISFDPCEELLELS